MPPTKPKKPAHSTPADTSHAVEVFMASLDHPHKPLVEALRRAILAIDPSVLEGIKWNAPSFRTTEYFATTNLRAKSGVGLVLHLGAKSRALPPGGVVVADPHGLLKWLGNDRALVEFESAEALEARLPALSAVLSEWLKYV